MYLHPIGVAIDAWTTAPLSVTDAVSNLALVTLGTVLGGTVLVVLVDWSVYLTYSD
jgi:formate/nitrite transporter FocA (FNT family)